MISKETLQTVIADLSRSGQGVSKNEFFALMSEIAVKEPHFLSFLTMFFMQIKTENVLSGAIVAVSLYNRFLKSQELAEDLKKHIPP